MLPSGPLMLPLSLQISQVGVLQGLSGAFMSAQVILLSVVLGAGAMSMCGIAAVFESYLLRFAHNHYQCTYYTVRRTGPKRGAGSTIRTGSANPAYHVQSLHFGQRLSV